MQFKFISINGDDVGEKIGNAIASDNHEELSGITGSLKEAHGSVEKWAESKGGEIITSAGDEAIVKIPGEGFDFSEIEGLRDDYAKISGHSATIGIGDTMSEASKALIYGKMNEKDQIVEYDSHIDDYIADYNEDDESETLDDEVEDQEDMEEADENQGEYRDEGEKEEMPEEQSFREEMDDEYSDKPGDKEEFDYEDYEEEPGEDESEETEDIDFPDIDDDETEHPISGESAGEETDEEIPGEEDKNLMEEGDISEEDLDEDSEEILADITEEGEDNPQSPEEATEEIEAPADHLDGDYGSEEMADAQPPHEMGMGEEEEFVHDAMENRDDELDADDIEADMEEAYGVEDHPGEEEDEYEDMAEQEEPQDKQSAMQEMMHASMGDEEEPQDNGELKQKIASTLLAFKENKQMLEQLQQSNPKMYEAQLAMLENMIDMAKILSMNPEQEADKMEAMGSMPGAEEQPEEEMMGKSEDSPKGKWITHHKEMPAGKLVTVKDSRKPDKRRAYRIVSSEKAGDKHRHWATPVGRERDVSEAYKIDKAEDSDRRKVQDKFLSNIESGKEKRSGRELLDAMHEEKNKIKNKDVKKKP